jgi:hypothetical protein
MMKRSYLVLLIASLLTGAKNPDRPTFTMRPTTSVCVGVAADEGIIENPGDPSSWMAQRVYYALAKKFGRQIPGVPNQGQRVWPYSESYMRFCRPSSETIFIVIYYGYKDGQKFLVKTIAQQGGVSWDDTTFSDAEGEGLKPATTIIKRSVVQFNREMELRSKMIADLIEFEGF